MRVAQIGLGAMGMPTASNLRAAGHELIVFDLSHEALAAAAELGCKIAESPAAAAVAAAAVVTFVPNDAILREVTLGSDGVLSTAPRGCVHLSCSTVHPDTCRELARLHTQAGGGFVGAPVFARADGMGRREATFAVGGEDTHVQVVMPLLEALVQSSTSIYRFGPDPGAGAVTKLCGNFMIASAIESCAEAMSLAEKSGLDRTAVMSMLNGTIFDCLIYRGYGERVAKREHVPRQSDLVGPGFQLDLGLKDITLALDVARKVKSPMPFASVLHDRFLGAVARGRGQLDWSAIALSVSEDAGVKVEPQGVEKRPACEPFGAGRASTGSSCSPEAKRVKH